MSNEPAMHASPGTDVVLTHTNERDFGTFMAAESDEDTRRWLGDVSVGWHRRAIDDPSLEHLSVIGADGSIEGFVVLAGLGQPRVELRRIVILPASRGNGIGQAALDAAVTRAFDVHHATCVWLDVKAGNTRAQRLYARAGFTVEREIRDALEEPDGTLSSLVVLSHLRERPGQDQGSDDGPADRPARRTIRQ
jgi:RimJ/RimL family protein N-acetyltransferase